MEKSLSSDDMVDLAEEHHKAGRLQEAEFCYRKALQLDPGHPGALYYLANIAYDDGRLVLAKQLIDELFRDEPNDAEAWHLLGMVALKEENISRAIECLNKALAIQPAYVQACYSLGDALNRQGEFDAAFESYQRALMLNPKFAEAYSNLSQRSVSQAGFSDGDAAFQRAVILTLQDPRSLYNLAMTVHKLGRLTETVEYLSRVVALDPSFREARSALLSTSQYLSNCDREAIFRDHVGFGEHFETPLRKNWPQYPGSINPLRRLRVGFVSGDLNAHPVGIFLVGVLRELRCQNDVDIIVYAMNRITDAVTDRLRDAAHNWSVISSLSDDALERKIREDNIDILIDLSGHTPLNRLLVFARKPAPIQVTWLGYWETTGLRAIDYIFCDRYSVHDNEEKYFVEEPWYLPHTRLCFTLPNEIVAVARLPALSNGYVTFGCFNNLAKMTDKVVSVWSSILKRVPNARLRLKSQSLSFLNARANVTARFAAEGIPADRLQLEPASPRMDYFAAYNGVDIALDPFPFTGATTSIDGIWMGVPMITLSGDRIISRQGESILHNLGLQDWIAENEDDYVELAVRRAGDLASLALLRSQLRAKLEASPLCDAKLFAQHLQEAFGQMWEKYCQSFTDKIH